MPTKDLDLPQSRLTGPARMTPTHGNRRRIWAFIILDAKVLGMRPSDWLSVMSGSRSRVLLSFAGKPKIRKQAKKNSVSEDKASIHLLFV